MENNSFFSKFTHKQTFFIGIATALGLVFTVGFFILLPIAMRGGEVYLNKDQAANVQPVVAAPSVNDSANKPSNEIQLTAVTNDDWLRGDKKAKITVVEYSDTECPFCKRFHPTMKKLLETYPNDVNWVYRHFPLTSIHSKAPKEAEATECAGELAGNDGFWKYLDRIFEVTPGNNGLDSEQLPKIAEEVGIDRKKFEACLNSGKYAQKVQDQANGGLAAGVQGTPHSIIVVGDEKIPLSGAVPLEQLKAIVDSALQAK